MLRFFGSRYVKTSYPKLSPEKYLHSSFYDDTGQLYNSQPFHMRYILLIRELLLIGFDKPGLDQLEVPL